MERRPDYMSEDRHLLPLIGIVCRGLNKPRKVYSLIHESIVLGKVRWIDVTQDAVRLRPRRRLFE